MRDSHRAEAERLLARAVEEEVRRSGGRTDGSVLLSRARGALDAMAGTAAEEYEAYTKALDEGEAGRLTFGQRWAREGAGTPLLVAVVAAVAACRRGPGARHEYGDGARCRSRGRCRGRRGDGGEGDRFACAGRAVAGPGRWGQPGGPEQLRLQWLTALEVRGIRPFLDQQRVLSASTGPKRKAPQLRGTDKSAAARRRSRAGAVLRPTPGAGGPVRGPPGRSWRGSRSGCTRPARVRRPSRRWSCCTARRARAAAPWRSVPRTS